MKIQFLVLLTCLHGISSFVIDASESKADLKIYGGHTLKSTNYETRSTKSEADQRNTRVIAESNREKRFIFIAEFLGGFFADYAVNAGVEALESFLGKEDPIEELQASVDQLIDSVENLQEGVNKLGKGILNLQLSNVLSSFATTILSLNLQMNDGLVILTKENLNRYEQDQLQNLLDQLLDSGNGIEKALSNLHLTIIGKNNFPNKHAFEIFFEKVMSDRETNPFKADSKLRSDVLVFLRYLLQLQTIGYNVLYTATSAKYKGDPEMLDFSKQDVKNKEIERQNEQKEYLAETFFKPCDTISLPNYPGRPKSLSCTDGFDFGSICKQNCAGSCASQKGRYDKYWYPPYGFPDVQCLLNGKWSKNVKDETLVQCTFCAEDSSLRTQPSVPYQCIKYDSFGSTSGCSATKKVNVGLHTGRPCQNGCHALRRFENRYGSSSTTRGRKTTVRTWKAWCYIEGKKWEYCLPEKVLRQPDATQNGKTVKGETCRTECNPGTRSYWKNWHWCYKNSGWDYCS